MLHIEEIVSLKSYNTFGINVKADFFITFHSEDEIKEWLMNKELQAQRNIILGGGSNVLFLSDYKGVVLHPALKGMHVISIDEDYVVVKVAAGEVWDDFVCEAVNNGWGGVENLSLIPGRVGAAPIQNIGAYGVEAKDTIIAVEGYFLDSKEFFHLNNFECEFGYRSSIFKTRYAEKFIITSVIFRLTRNKHNYNLSYQGLAKVLEKRGETNLANIRDTIIEIRRNKLPDPEIIGNAGSFFKNPVISQSKALLMKKAYPKAPIYEFENNKYKISAAWLIEQCGWKGYRKNDAGVYDKQPLVLVNYGSASGEEIFELSCQIQDSVMKKFGIELEREVNVIV